jgi:5-methyltetrahydrofolate--homocysteine methyltransferase
MTMIIIGERLNSTRKPVREALERRLGDFLEAEALRQKEAGAQYIDLNAAALMEEEVSTVSWAVPLLQRAASLPLAIDSPNPEAIEAGLKAHQGRALLNSLTAERSRIERLLPLVRDYKPRVIVLCLDDEGMPKDPDSAVTIARKMVELLACEGLAAEDIFIDPLVRPVAAEPGAARLFLDSLAAIKRALPGVRTVAGLSNVSFGLPLRGLINRSLLVMALERGLDAAICDPLERDLQASLRAAEALLGRDPSMKIFLRFARDRK